MDARFELSGASPVNQIPTGVAMGGLAAIVPVVGAGVVFQDTINAHPFPYALLFALALGLVTLGPLYLLSPSFSAPKRVVVHTVECGAGGVRVNGVQVEARVFQWMSTSNNLLIGPHLLHLPRRPHNLVEIERAVKGAWAEQTRREGGIPDPRLDAIRQAGAAQRE